MLVQMMLSPILSLLLVLRLSTRLLSPVLESMCQLEIKPGWQCGQQWRPHSLGWGAWDPPLHDRGSFCCGSMCWGSFTAAISCSNLKQAPQLLSELES